MKNKISKSRWIEIIGKTVAAIFILILIILGGILIYIDFKEKKLPEQDIYRDNNIAKIMEKFSADISEEERLLLDPLRGIDKLIVLVEALKEKAISFGLNRAELENIIETKLRKNGMTILDKMDPYTPKIYVNVHVTEQAFSIYMAILEDVSLTRNPSVTCDASTWFNGTTGTHGDDPEYIISALSQLLDKFFNDYNNANPNK